MDGQTHIALPLLKLLSQNVNFFSFLGSLIRHACGALGETEHPAEAFLNRVTHLFDCIEMGQAYHFHEGEVTFSSQFYDTNAVDIWLSYGENMNQSSVWWGTVYADRNLTALAR